MTILKQSLIFDEALRDSPLFKAYLKGYEDRMERFEDGVTKVRFVGFDIFGEHELRLKLFRE